jgi:hypothetical protein
VGGAAAVGQEERWAAWTAAGGSKGQTLRIRDKGRRNEDEKGKEKHEKGSLGSEYAESRGRCVGPFPSLTRSRLTQVIATTNLEQYE